MRPGTPGPAWRFAPCRPTPPNIATDPTTGTETTNRHNHGFRGKTSGQNAPFTDVGDPISVLSFVWHGPCIRLRCPQLPGRPGRPPTHRSPGRPWALWGRPKGENMTPAFAPRRKKIRVTGRLSAAGPPSASTDGRLVLTSLNETGEHASLLISQQGIGWELRAFTNDLVTVTGHIRKSRQGGAELYVTAYGLAA